jgi:hypothetical protein
MSPSTGATVPDKMITILPVLICGDPSGDHSFGKNCTIPNDISERVSLGVLSLFDDQPHISDCRYPNKGELW